MKKMFMLLAVLPFAAGAQQLPTGGFAECIRCWTMEHGDLYERYASGQFREIAGNIVAWQNRDGGWPKNIDVTARMSPDSLRRCIDPALLRSTLGNTNVYPQIEYLANVYYLTGDTLYSGSARRGMEYLLARQRPGGGWTARSGDSAAFDAKTTAGVLALWLDVLQAKPAYAWVDDALKSEVRTSWNRGLEQLLANQCAQDGVKTGWLAPCGGGPVDSVEERSGEFPAVSAPRTARIVELLMRIHNPSPEVSEAVKAAVAWFEKTEITGERVVTVDVPEGLNEDRTIKSDRMLVNDSEAGPLWARCYDPESGRPFFGLRDGAKVWTLSGVPAGSRVNGTWYGTWGREVLKKYPEWLARTAKEAAQAARETRKAQRKAARQAQK